MDDVLEKGGKKPGGTTPAFTGSENVTFLGGLPQQNVKNLTGCMRNVFIKRLEKPHNGEEKSCLLTDFLGFCLSVMLQTL